VSVSPASITLAPGETQQLAVTATMGDESTKDVTSGTAGTVYKSSSTGVATVDTNGLITIPTTATPGAGARITVTNGGFSQVVIITVQ
jgi:hypothetical protein